MAFLPTSTEVPCHKNVSLFSRFRNHIILKIQTFFGHCFLGSFFGSGAIFENFFGLGLIIVLYPDVSTTSPASFFTVMPKGLTTGPKSRLDYSSRKTTHDPCGIAFSFRQNSKKGYNKMSCTLELMVSRTAKNRILLTYSMEQSPS
jgi:hypothetical protein